MPANPEEAAAFFAEHMRKALAKIQTDHVASVRKHSEFLAALTGLHSSFYVGPLLKLHTELWDGFCRALSSAYTAELLPGVICSECGHPIEEQQCPKCRAPRA